MPTMTGKLVVALPKPSLSPHQQHYYPLITNCQKYFLLSSMPPNKLSKDKDEEEGVIAFGESLTSRGNNSDTGHKRLSPIKFQEDVQPLILDEELGQCRYSERYPTM